MAAVVTLTKQPITKEDVEEGNKAILANWNELDAKHGSCGLVGRKCRRCLSEYRKGKYPPGTKFQLHHPRYEGVCLVCGSELDDPAVTT
jgi:hypothetical protein